MVQAGTIPASIAALAILTRATGWAIAVVIDALTKRAYMMRQSPSALISKGQKADDQPVSSPDSRAAPGGLGQMARLP
jgi:hypothetical protein